MDTRGAEHIWVLLRGQDCEGCGERGSGRLREASLFPDGIIRTDRIISSGQHTSQDLRGLLPGGLFL